MKQSGEIGIGPENSLIIMPELHDADCLESAQSTEGRQLGYRLHTLSGPSGSGKGTLQREIDNGSYDVAMRFGSLEPSVSSAPTVTSRKPRDGEKEGVHYYFVTPQEHEAMFERGELAERNVFSKGAYGARSIEGYVSRGYENRIMLELNIDGVLAFHDRYDGIHSTFLVPESWQAQHERLLASGDRNELDHRLKESVAEIYFAYVSDMFNLYITREGEEHSSAIQVGTHAFGVTMAEADEYEVNAHVYDMLLEKRDVLVELGLVTDVPTPDDLVNIDEEDATKRLEFAIQDWQILKNSLYPEA